MLGIKQITKASIARIKEKIYELEQLLGLPTEFLEQMPQDELSSYLQDLQEHYSMMMVNE